MKVVQRCLLALSCVASVMLSPMTPVAAATAPAAAPLPSWDRTVFRPTGAVTTTRVSGRGGFTDIITTPTPDFLFRLRARERSDEPCDNRARFFHERPQSPRVPTRIAHYERRSSRKCASGAWGNANSELSAVVAGGGYRHSDGRVRVMAGVRVCMNRQRTRVKGIKVYGASINNDGDVRRDSAYSDHFSRSNCHTWERARMCPAQQVATGVHFNYSGRSLVGIALECQAVRTVQLATRD
ncbi:MAG: hypothetical protein JKY37_27325 [Nannocystaceae bacterium]|nr:hypothetical protein [Nannocystaceae bacterium]